MEGNCINYNEVASVYNSIKELYINYCEELDREKRNLDQVSNDIKETKDYLTYLENHQKSDAFVFSPRGVISKNNSSIPEGIYDTGKTIDFSDVDKKKEELTSLEKKKNSIEDNIKKLGSIITVLDSNKNILKDVLNKKEIIEKEQKDLADKKEEMEKELEQKKEEIAKDLEHKNEEAIKSQEQRRDDIKNRIEKGPVENLSYITHMVNMTHTFIDNDPMRAKLELKNIEKSICSVVDELKQIVKIPEGEK